MLKHGGFVCDFSGLSNDLRISGQLVEKVKYVGEEFFVADPLDAFVGTAVGILIGAVAVAADGVHDHAGAADCTVNEA